MEKGLTAYATNKIISLGWVAIVIIASALALGYTPTQWQLILILLISFGHAHFLIGFYYQCKGFLRKEQPWQHFLTFAVLVLLTLILVQLLATYVGFAAVLFIGFVYFLLHGLFNEQTLILRQTGVLVPLIYIGSLAVFIMSLLTYSVPDPTFLFDRALNFAPQDNFFLVIAFSQSGLSLSVFSYIFWSGMVASFGLLLVAWLRSRYTKLTLFLSSSYLLILFATFMWGSFSYIYMYFFVIGYHFMTWFLFYFVVMRARGKNEFRHFLALHIAFGVVCVIAGWLFFTSYRAPQWVMVLFDYKYFVIATYIHITTSFMNDQWFQTVQQKVFQYVG